MLVTWPLVNRRNLNFWFIYFETHLNLCQIVTHTFSSYLLQNMCWVNHSLSAKWWMSKFSQHWPRTWWTSVWTWTWTWWTWTYRFRFRFSKSGCWTGPAGSRFSQNTPEPEPNQTAVSLQQSIMDYNKISTRFLKLNKLRSFRNYIQKTFTHYCREGEHNDAACRNICVIQLGRLGYAFAFATLSLVSPQKEMVMTRYRKLPRLSAEWG